MSAADTFEIDERRPEKAAWLRHWDWFFVLSVAWLLFDLFMQPVLSIMIASFKFGWNDFANGFWLWLRDSNFRRGRTCLVFYVATGLWRITVTTFSVTLVGLFVYGFWQAFNGPPGGAAGNAANDDVTMVSMLIVMLCFALSSFATWLAVFLALKNRVRVWVDSTVRISRRMRLWPPQPVGKNQLSRVVTSSLIFAFAIGASFAMGKLADGFVRARPGAGPNWRVAASILSIVVFGLLALAGRSWLLRKLAAASAADCWDAVAPAGNEFVESAEPDEESLFEPDFDGDA